MMSLVGYLVLIQCEGRDNEKKKGQDKIFHLLDSLMS